VLRLLRCCTAAHARLPTPLRPCIGPSLDLREHYWCTATWRPSGARCTPKGGPGSCPAWPRWSPAATRAPPLTRGGRHGRRRHRRITVDRPRDDVAAFLWDPANDREWIGGLRSARLVTPAPAATRPRWRCGSRATPAALLRPGRPVPRRGGPPLGQPGPPHPQAGAGDPDPGTLLAAMAMPRPVPQTSRAGRARPRAAALAASAATSRSRRCRSRRPGSRDPGGRRPGAPSGRR
jgi:hypothetical protein